MIKNNIYGHFAFKLTPRIITLLLIIIQSCGIRFVVGQGSFLIVVVLFLCRSGLKQIKQKDFLFLITAFSFLLVSTILNPSLPLSKLIFQMGVIVEAYVFLLSYKGNFKELVDDLYKTLNLIFIHALIGYILYLIIPFLFTSTKSFGYPYNTLLYFFYVTDPSVGAARNTGLMWEPGLLQLTLNILLFYNIKRNNPPWLMVIIVLTIISTVSTTGYITLGLNFLYFILHNYKKNKRIVVKLLTASILFSSSIFFISDNIGDKFSGDNTSGLARYRDYLIGIELIKEKPIMGHGLFETSYLTSKSYVRNIETNIFSKEYLDISEEMSGGYTNGLLAFISWYGIPLSLLVFYFFYKNFFISGNFVERSIYFLIIFFTLISEPITYTAFFLIFPLSYVVFKNNANKKRSVRYLNNEKFALSNQNK